jgi:hypothetical protein
MTEIVVPLEEAKSQTDTDLNHNRKLWQRAAVTSVLASTAVTAFFAERYGWTRDWAEVPRDIANSAGHPVFGYVGTYAAAAAATTYKRSSAFINTTIINFAAEQLQTSLIYPNYNPFSAPHLPETFKDYAAALGGGMLFHAMNRRQAETVESEEPLT